MSGAVRVLVTGANGFLGAHVTRALCERGHEVSALVQPGTPIDDIAALPARRHEGDLTRPETLAAPMRGIEVVVHLAAVARDWGPPALFEHVNVGGTRNLLQAARRAGARRMVLMSSVAVHAYVNRERMDEEAPRDGGSFPYASSKIAAEDLLRGAHGAGWIEGVVLRPGLVPYGPGDRAAFVPLARAFARGFMPLVDGGRYRLSLSYAENLAEGVALAVHEPRAAGRTFLLADDERVTWRDYFEAIARALALRPRPLPLPSRLLPPLAGALESVALRLPGQPEPPLTRYRARLLTHDLDFRGTRAREVLGWRPTVSLEEGMARTARWYRSL